MTKKFYLLVKGGSPKPFILLEDSLGINPANRDILNESDNIENLISGLNTFTNSISDPVKVSFYRPEELKHDDSIRSLDENEARMAIGYLQRTNILHAA